MIVKKSSQINKLNFCDEIRIQEVITGIMFQWKTSFSGKFSLDAAFLARAAFKYKFYGIKPQDLLLDIVALFCESAVCS